MSEQPEPLPARDGHDEREASGAKAFAAFGDAARPEILLPGASLSLGLSLLLLQPHPLLHPLLSYAILCAPPPRSSCTDGRWETF